jgi:hypothetical protein
MPITLDNGRSLALCFCHEWPEWPVAYRIESVAECSVSSAEPAFESPWEGMGERPYMAETSSPIPDVSGRR